MTTIASSSQLTKNEIIALTQDQLDELNDRILARTILSVADPEINAPVYPANSSPAFQYAADSGIPVYVPGNQYKLNTPVKFGQGFQIFGIGGAGLVNGISTPGIPILRPVTAAFVPVDPLNQIIGVSIKGLGFYGGTTQLDLGLAHGVYLEDLEFFNPTVAALCLVRGESHEFHRLRIDFQVASTYGMCFGYEASINYNAGLNEYGGVNPATFFDSPDAWTDRMHWSQIKFQSGATTSWTTAAIHSRLLGGWTADNITFHGPNAGSACGKLFNCAVRWQTSDIRRLILDQINTSTTPVEGFKSPLTKDVTIQGAPMNFGANCRYSKAFDLGTLNKVTFIACDAPGDNSSRYGFYLADGWSQEIIFIGCSGALYAAGSNALIQGQIKQIGCSFENTNIAASGTAVVDWYDGAITLGLNGDPNGAATTDGMIRGYYSKGSGQLQDIFQGTKDGFMIPYGSRIIMETDQAGAIPAIVAYEGDTPEGNVTSLPGSIVLRTLNNNNGRLFLKRGGTGDTGYVQVKTYSISDNINYTADGNISVDTVGALHQNSGASATITLTLPAAVEGLEFFVRRINATHVLQLDPNGTDHFEGEAAGKYKSFDTDGAYLIIHCYVNTLWHVMASYGTITMEP